MLCCQCSVLMLAAGCFWLPTLQGCFGTYGEKSLNRWLLAAASGSVHCLSCCWQR